MEFKIFGPGGSPDSDFREDLQTLFELDDTGWDALSHWFLETREFDTEEGAASAEVVASSLLPEQFTAGAEALKYLLESWRLYDLTIPDIQRDILLMGFHPEYIERLGPLLKKLSPVKDRAYAEYIRFDHENAVLPTLEDMSIVCDLRPVFEDTAYPLPQARRTMHTRLIGYTHMILMQISTEDSDGRTRQHAFQMTEERLVELQSALQRASQQLAILKASTRAIQIENQ